MSLPYLVGFLALCDENQLFHRSQTNKTNKQTFYRLLGFILDMLELHGGLEAQSLSKVVFSEMRDSQMEKTHLFTHPEPKKQIKPTFCRLWGFTLDAFELDGGLKTESL